MTTPEQPALAARPVLATGAGAGACFPSYLCRLFAKYGAIA
jgi:hypothetical protein